MIQKKDENGEKYVTATTRVEFHEALNRGLAVELTERIGVPMNEDVGTVAEAVEAGGSKAALKTSRPARSIPAGTAST